MTSKHLLITTALAGLLVVGQAHAQGSGGGSGGQQGTSAGQAQGGAQGQRLAQEQAQSQGTQIYVSTAGTRQIQQALNKAGYSVGNVDGKWNQETQNAAKNFQQAKGLEPTGTLTVRTIMALGLEDQVLTPQNIAQGAGQAQGGAQGQRLAQETAVGQGTPLYISPAGTRQIQQALNKAGYSVGNVDGQWNDQTRTAARNFQQAQGLEPNGQLDIALINALGLNQQIFQPNIQGGGQQTAQGGGQGGGQGGAAGQASGGLQGQRLAQETSTGQGTPLYASPATVREITQALNKAGYSGGNVDGNWDQKTASAAKNFQQAKGLEPTGTLTTEMMAALGMTNWTQGSQGGSPTSTGAVGGASGGATQSGGAGAAGGASGMGATGGTGSGGAAGQTITITPQKQ